MIIFNIFIVYLQRNFHFLKFMNRIFIRSTFKTPHVNFDSEKGLIEMKGKSIPEHAKMFYSNLIEWIIEYSQNPQTTTTVNLQLEYVNTDTKKYLLEIVELFGEMHKNGKEINVNWYYEEEDEGMMETGEEYEEMADMPFNLIEVEEFGPVD